jgi:uncharacterized protein
MKRNNPVRGRFPGYLRAGFVALVIAAAVVVIALGFLTYRVTHPGMALEPVNPSHYLLPSLDVKWTSGEGSEVAGWFIPGREAAPAIVLSPGYGMSRSDGLSLALSLHELGYHLLIYAQRGCGAVPKGASSLGLHETDDLQSALAFLKLRPGIDPRRIGLWGVDEGARAALAVAARHPEVRAIAADAPFEYTLDFVAHEVNQQLGFANALIASGCRVMFRLAHWEAFEALGRPLPIEALVDRNILIIEGSNRKEMSDLVTALHRRLQPHIKLLSVPASRMRMMTGEEMKSYDRQVADFFHANLTFGGRP